MAADMTLDTLLSTKVQIPLARSNAVMRPRLLARLNEGLDLGRRLTLVCAPPGFGKTTLIREWLGVVERPAAWLSVDEEDNDGERFLRYLAAALSQAGRGAGPDGSLLPGPASPRERLVALINSLAESRTQLLLVLDDYHLISNFAVHELVGFLLANQPPNLHVVIGSREDPPLPLARMRARDQVTEIREAALRFRPDETTAFLSHTMKLDLPPRAVASLAARTEGWITGLQLAGLALSESDAADEFVTAFALDDRYILDYLTAEVLDRQPEAVRSFVRQTSILDRLSAPLCNALTDREDSQAILEHLERANLFLLPLDGRREWYRYHVIFAEVIRLTLPRQQQLELHEKAAAWLEGHDAHEAAMHHNRLLDGLAVHSRAPLHSGADQPLIEPLSEREIEVLHLIAEGYSNAEIAQRLVISTGTVKRHTNNIYGKLGAASRTQAVAKARSLRLIV